MISIQWTPKAPRGRLSLVVARTIGSEVVTTLILAAPVTYSWIYRSSLVRLEYLSTCNEIRQRIRLGAPTPIHQSVRPYSSRLVACTRAEHRWSFAMAMSKPLTRISRSKYGASLARVLVKPYTLKARRHHAEVTVV